MLLRGYAADHDDTKLCARISAKRHQKEIAKHFGGAPLVDASAPLVDAMHEGSTSTNAPLVDASAPLVDAPAIGKKVRRRRPLLTHSLVCLAGAVAGAGIAVALFVALPHTPDDPPPPLPSCPNVTCGRLDGTFRGSVDSSVSIFGVPVRLAWDISHRFNSTNGTVEVVQTSHSPHAPSFHCPATPYNVSDGCAVSIGLCYGDARDVQAQWDGADNLTVATMIHTALFSKRFVWAESRD